VDTESVADAESEDSPINLMQVEAELALRLDAEAEIDDSEDQVLVEAQPRPVVQTDDQVLVEAQPGPVVESDDLPIKNQVPAIAQHGEHQDPNMEWQLMQGNPSILSLSNLIAASTPDVSQLVWIDQNSLGNLVASLPERTPTHDT
jgi:hypothetical protein